ncbi:MAG: hypothetical protein AB2777_21965, partial [Candidatus Thiodiazotropha endolucinida]
KRLISDASLIDANVSIDSMVERPDGDPDAKALKNYQQRYHDFREDKKQRRVSNQTHINHSDPEATLVSRKGMYRKMAYKVALHTALHVFPVAQRPVLASRGQPAMESVLRLDRSSLNTTPDPELRSTDITR